MSVRPSRPGAGVVAPLLVLACGVAFGLTAGASLVFIAVAALATAFATGVVLAATGAARTVVVLIDGPDVGIAGEPVRLVVTSVAMRRVIVEVGDGPHVVARWSPPLGRHRVAVDAVFPGAPCTPASPFRCGAPALSARGGGCTDSVPIRCRRDEKRRWPWRGP